MDNQIERVLKCIGRVADEICERQMYCFPGFDPETDDPTDFFAARGIEFDGELFVRFPTSQLFAPIPKADLLAEAKTLGLTLPADYVEILSTFGSFTPPGNDIWSPVLRPTEACSFATGYGYPEIPIAALAIADFNNVSDGNAIGFLCDRGVVEPTLFRFEHENQFDPDEPRANVKPIADSLAEFLISYLEK
jgi:hypothetical protein